MEKTVWIWNEPWLVRPAGCGYEYLTAGGWAAVEDDIYEDVARQYRGHLTYSELAARFVEHNRTHNVRTQFSDASQLKAVIVFKPESWPGQRYSLLERSYEVVSDNKAFIPGLGWTSLFGNCLDGKDLGVRLDDYIRHAGWQVDYCYIR